MTRTGYFSLNNAFLLILNTNAMQCVKGQTISFPIFQPPYFPPPCRLVSSPDPLIVRLRTCLLLHPLADLLNFMEDWSSGTLRRSLAARHPLPQLKPDPSLRHIGTKEPHSALCPVNTRFGINCIHSTENWDSASRGRNPTSNYSKLTFLSLPSYHTIWN